MHEAAENGQIEALTLLIALKANINARDNASRTPLKTALKAGQLKAAAVLRQQVPRSEPARSR